MRRIAILLLSSLLLAACSLIPGLQGEQTYRSSLPLVDKPAPTQVVVLPVVSGQGGQPEPSWQLFPQLLDASLPNINFSIRITSPVMSGEAAVQHAAFSQAVQALVDEWMRAYSPEQLGTPDPELPWSVNISYQVTSAPDWVPAIPFAVSSKAPEQQNSEQVIFQGGREVLSILFEDFAYLGGAHPGMFYVALNYDAGTGKVLALQELFKPGTDYLGLISSLSIADLQSRTDLSGVLDLNGANPSEENYRVWAITPQGLLIIFSEYQVAPGAAGAQSVLIPYETLSAQLDPAGPLSSFSK
jgi:hypothetical protein